MDTAQARTASIFDAYLGRGADLTAGEQGLVEEVREIAPEVPIVARESRRFRRRAIRDLVSRGITQFLDLGCGNLTGEDDVHLVARETAPDARVVYLDSDPDVVASASQRLAGDQHSAVMLADLREPEGLLAQSAVQQLIDPARPVGVLACMVLHCLTDQEQPMAILRRLRQHLSPGSYLVVSHITGGEFPEQANAGAEVYRRRHASTPMVLRTEKQIRELFEGWNLVPPGLVTPVAWWPDEDRGLAARRAWAAVTAPDWVLAGVAELTDDPGRAC